MLSNLLLSLWQQDRIVLSFALVLITLVATIILIFDSFSLYLKCVIKRFIRIQFRKWLLDPDSRPSDTGIFASFYRNSLCHMQKMNNDLLAKILHNNHSCAFFLDRSISFLSSPTRPGGYVSIDEFREKVLLTTYEDYRNYIDRIVQNGEKNVLTTDKIVYFATTSGTTGRSKLIPIAASTVKPGMMLMRAGSTRILTFLPSLFPSPEQRIFQLYSGKKTALFSKTKDGTPIGPLSLYRSGIPSSFILKLAISTYDVVPFDLIEGIPDFETSTFVQLVFALAIPDIYSYTVNFAPAFIHSIKIIEKYFEEISQCISNANFDHSSLVQDNISDFQLRTKLNRALNEVTIEYGGFKYRLKRAEHIRKECLKKDVPGILHRLWPTLLYASTVLGSSYTMYKDKIQGYCGEKLRLINLFYYLASEGAFGSLASIHTDEYFLSPAHTFLEFIKEEDIHQDQPKTVVISEIEPGYRYELVITTEAGLVRYRTGDVLYCTRFLSRADDLVPLPIEPAEIPRIPLISMAYRIGSLLNVNGEKTTEEHLLYALQQTIYDWKDQGIIVELCDFTSFPKLDAFPVHYVIFLELINVDEHKVNDQKRQIMQDSVDSKVERYLRMANNFYHIMRDAGRFGPVICLLIRSGTFSTFREKIFMTQGVGPLQVKPHRLLKDDDHIRFFYDNKINDKSI